jgi:hypothetical protein
MPFHSYLCRRRLQGADLSRTGGSRRELRASHDGLSDGQGTTMNETSINKEELLRSLGYGGALADVDALLEDSGLSRVGKKAIHPGKREAVEAVLDENFVFHCGRGDCQTVAASDAGSRALCIASSPEFCSVCGGSAASQAINEMCVACEAAGWQRLCVLGGSPTAREQLSGRVGGRLELRLVDGLAARSGKQASSDVAWADHVVIWATTQLNHSASKPYTGAKVSVAWNRGLRSLARHVATMARRQIGGA